LIKDGVDGRLKHYSLVHEGTGFKAASVRAVISASQMLARSKTTKVAVFKAIADAADWHARHQHAISTRSAGASRRVASKRSCFGYAIPIPQTPVGADIRIAR
jgi:hypothetical protein